MERQRETQRDRNTETRRDGDTEGGNVERMGRKRSNKTPPSDVLKRSAELAPAKEQEQEEMGQESGDDDGG